MRNLKYYFLGLLTLGFFVDSYAHVNPKKEGKGKPAHSVSYRMDCALATAQIDQDINNVRARLLNGGDVWWDGSGDGKYIVPKVDPASGLAEVSSIFAGAVWLGGVDDAGNLKLAAQTYGTNNGETDFWPGPLTQLEGDTGGETSADTCANWDRFFTVTGEEIDAHLKAYEASVNAGVEYTEEQMPRNIKGWPARGNEFFFDVHSFDLPNTMQGLAAFWDVDLDGNYEPNEGDYPRIEIRGCETPEYPDQMIFWIYNDNGGIHTESMGDPIKMEVQVQAFGYKTNDAINNMTFQRYKLINRAPKSIDSMFFAMWVDPDLGCYTDDYIGCDVDRSLAYVYNEDAADGTTGTTCEQGVATYGTEIPIIGVDYFRGPRDENGVEIGMSSFTYYNNGGLNPPPPQGTDDPGVAAEFYNYLSGSWRDGTPFTFGGNAYNAGSSETVDYAFFDDPDTPGGWSMCEESLPPGDRRTVQASGPFRLDPGAVNELIVGAVWVPDLPYPCPNIDALLAADDLAQALFDNCFNITDGPDAPDMEIIELDRELIFVLTNDTTTSNNAFEMYSEKGLTIPTQPGIDSLYRFEGYTIYQFSGPDVDITEIDDPEKARPIFTVDKKNDVARIINWEKVEGIDLNGNPVYVPVPEAENATDAGVRHTFRVTDDQFSTGEDKQIVNHKKYYFTALAYAYNEYEEFEPSTGRGQQTPHLTGRKNIGDDVNDYYTAIPRPITSVNLNASYESGPQITRFDGIGAGGNNLELTEESVQEILAATGEKGVITYQSGRGPIQVQVYDPISIQDNKFEFKIVDNTPNNSTLDDNATWVMRNLTDPSAPSVVSESTLEELNEQIIAAYGFSISIGQTVDAGDKDDETNGLISASVDYADPNGAIWYNTVADLDGDGSFAQAFQSAFNYIKTSPDEVDQSLDPANAFKENPTGFIPFRLADYQEPEADDELDFYITPAWKDQNQGNVRIGTPGGEKGIANVNNVDIVFTSDRTKWSRCIVVEAASEFYTGSGWATEGNVKQMTVRPSPSVSRDDFDENGMPLEDGTGTTGFGWFPGYAIDIETGCRVNIFFGENSTYDCEVRPDLCANGGFDGGPNGNATGRDMVWNPTSQLITDAQNGISIYSAIAGAQHFIYVTNQPYDECAQLREALKWEPPILNPVIGAIPALQTVTWTAVPLIQQGQELLSPEDGLIPNDVTVKLRVQNPYQVKKGALSDANGYPTYQFDFTGVEASPLTTDAEIDSQLDMINVVPNPYYGFSSYETGANDNRIKITNLPAKCTVTIYSLEGRFIREYRRDEEGIARQGSNPARAVGQISPAIEWDLKNNKGIPISSGIYLIHINADGLGERVVKWFGVGRQFDPSGL